MDFDCLYLLYDYVDIDDIKNLALSSKIAYEAMSTKYKKIVSLNDTIKRMVNNNKKMISIGEEIRDNNYGYQDDDYYEELNNKLDYLQKQNIYYCICDYDFYQCEASNHFDYCDYIEELGFEVIYDEEIEDLKLVRLK